MPPLHLPPSYTTLPTTQIKLSHVPASSADPTPIILLTLNRPSNYNAFTDTMETELVSAFRLLDVDDRVRCIVVTGRGKMFCAGADLGNGTLDRKEGVNGNEHRDGGGRVALAIHQCRKPVIAAINGSAVGVGITMTLPMSIRICFEKAKIGFVFARRGLIMEAASSFFLPRLVGHSRAMHLVTTGATYPATHPLLNTLFSETLPTAEAVLPRALEIATEIVNNTSVVSFALMRDLIYRGPSSAEGTHLLDSRLIHEIFNTRDHDEGVKAFLEKRAVSFAGTMEKDAPSAYPWWDNVDAEPRPKAVNSSKL